MTSTVPIRPLINVTQHHIDKAIRNDSGHCMVADALRDSYPDAAAISVDIRTIRMTNPTTTERRTYLTPLTVARFLAQWDQGINPDPFQIRLSMPVQIRPSGRKGNGSRKVTGVVSGSSPTSHPIVLGGHPIPTGALHANATPRRGNTRGTNLGNRNAAGSRQFGIRNLNLTPATP